MSEMETVVKKTHPYQRRVYHIGEMFYLSGYASSKVMVVKVGVEKILVRYITEPTSLPGVLGTTRWVTRSVLYPRGER